jgi:hypothetical protein
MILAVYKTNYIENEVLYDICKQCNRVLKSDRRFLFEIKELTEKIKSIVEDNYLYYVYGIEEVDKRISQLNTVIFFKSKNTIVNYIEETDNSKVIPICEDPCELKVLLFPMGEDATERRILNYMSLQ